MTSKKTVDRRFFITSCIKASMAMSIMGLSACKDSKKYKIGLMDTSSDMLANTEEMFSQYSKIGIEGIQVGGGKINEPVISKDKLALYKSLMAKYNMEIPSVCVGCMNDFPFATYNKSLGYIKDAIDAAKELNAKNILLPFYGKASMQTPQKTFNESFFKPLVERLKEVALYAKQKGVTISMENNIPADDSKRIIDAVNSDMIKVYVDTMNYEFYGYNSPTEIKKLKGYIGEVHLKSLGQLLDAKNSKPKDMQMCIDEIINAGYTGWLVFELHGFNPKVHGKTIDCIKHNIEYVKNSKFFI